jgi:hypothetical protein
MNSTPGPVIFLLIVVPGRAIPSSNLNPIKMEAWDFAARLDVRGKARGKGERQEQDISFIKKPDVKQVLRNLRKKYLNLMNMS